MIIGPLNLAKAPTLTQCGSRKQTFCSNNKSPIASNHFSADPVLNPIVQTPGQIVLKPWCRGQIGLQRCAGVTGRKFWLRNRLQMSLKCLLLFPVPPLCQPFHLQKSPHRREPSQSLWSSHLYSDPHLLVSLSRQLQSMPELPERVTKLA